MRKKFVEEYHWLEEGEMLDMTAIAQSAPGPIAVNAAILLGYRLPGRLGSVGIHLWAPFLPPLIIISVISLGYTAFRDNAIVSMVLRGMQAGGDGSDCQRGDFHGLGHYQGKTDFAGACVMAGASLLSVFTGVNVLVILLGCGVDLARRIPCAP